MKKETRREIRKWMAFLLGASLCLASITYGYAGDAGHPQEASEAAGDMESGQEAPEQAEAAESLEEAGAPNQAEAAEEANGAESAKKEEGTAGASGKEEETGTAEASERTEGAGTAKEAERAGTSEASEKAEASGKTEEAKAAEAVQKAVDAAKKKVQDAVAAAVEKAQESADSLREAAAAFYPSASPEQPEENETDRIEVSDLNSLRNAVDQVEADGEQRSGQSGSWYGKRLLVQSESEFDAMGAKSVICGYGNVSILDYASEEEAKEAYERFQKLPGLTVEPDSAYCSMGEELERLFLQPETVMEAKPEEAGESVCVAVLDTGYDIQHYGTERICGSTDLSSEGTAQDGHGHGTAMANIVLSQTPGCVRVMPVKVADENGRTSSLKLYMGIRYAVENGADLINISMGSPQASVSDLVAEAIRQARQAGILTVVSAGNAGQDVSSYSPADAEAAVAVAAVNADKSRMDCSNYGAGVDYCSYGSLQALGLNGEALKCSGTSVSAAIVSGLAARKLAFKTLTCEALVTWLDKEAEDLGEPGMDPYFGKGFLAPAGLNGLEDTAFVPGEKLPELLACDWKQISDGRLNELIDESDELIVRRFLDQRSGEERKEVLARAPVLKRDHVELVCRADGREAYRSVDTYYRYLYSDRFEAYYVQQKISGTYYMYIQNASRKVYLTTNQNDAKCTLKVKFSGTKTNPADNPTITVSGTSAGAFDLSDARLDGIKTFTDDKRKPRKRFVVRRIFGIRKQPVCRDGQYGLQADGRRRRSGAE